MKCPKCEYLGFETGDRCKNCGYDFSLAADAASAREPELLLRQPEPVVNDANRWLDQLEARLDLVRPAIADPLAAMPLDSRAPAPTPAPARVSAATVAASASAPVPQVATQRPASRGATSLPLFHPGGAGPDEPLVKLPPSPRPPLAVRRTPERPRLRTVPKVMRRADPDFEPDPVLAFAEDSSAVVAARARPRAVASPHARPEISGAGRRLTAAVVDQLILLAIDGTVVYFTFQISGLSFASWRDVPLLPLALFLVMVKFAYFCVFTMLGGQTVGKMATGIRVVADNDRDVEPSQAIQRTLAALASVATVGIGFAPVLLGGDRRALHDRLAGTRVVGPLRPLHE